MASWDKSSWQEDRQEDRNGGDWKEDGWAQSKWEEKAADSGDACLVTGKYKDDRNSETVMDVWEEGGKFWASDPLERWPREDLHLTGNRITLWGLAASVSRGRITFDKNGATWSLVQDSHQPAESSSAAASSSQAAPPTTSAPASSAPADPWQNADPWGGHGAPRQSAAAPAAAAAGPETTDSRGSTSAWDAPAGNSGAGDSWGSAAQAPASSSTGSGWGTTNGATSGWGTSQSAAPDVDRQKASRLRDFKSYQDWHKQSGKLPGKSPEEFDYEEERLFKKQSTEGQDFSLYDQVECSITGPRAENIPNLTTFEMLFAQFKDQVPPALMANIRKCGFRTPTPVQKFSVTAGLSGRDLMVCAQTGSGKTAAFLIPVLASMIKYGKQTGTLTSPFDGFVKPDTLIISPTRELCVQTYEDALRFCHRTQHRVVRVYGQEPAKEQIKELALGADLLIGTPGRLWDFVSSGVVDVTEVHCLVMDEADRMLAMKMEEYIREIVEKFGMPSKEKRQTLMFSATFSVACQKLAQDYLYEHLFITVGAIGGAVCTVSQKLEQVDPTDKFQQLIDLLIDTLVKTEGEKILVFTNSKEQAKGLDETVFDKAKIDCGALHGDLPQLDREKNLDRFRKGEIKVLIATDVASRGLDIPGVGLVVNYDLPREVDIYVQRIGRTGRIGHRGQAVTFIAVSKDGQWTDSEECLKVLPKVMSDAGCQVPDWLRDKVAQLEAGAWVTADQSREWKKDREDARGGWETWAEREQAKRAAGGDGGDSGNAWQDSSATQAAAPAAPAPDPWN